MKAKIVRIGNSQGVRIPKIMLTDSRLEEDVELEIVDEGILIRPAKNPRQNWEARFREMSSLSKKPTLKPILKRTPGDGEALRDLPS